VSAEADELRPPAEPQLELDRARVIVPAPAWHRGVLESGSGRKARRALRFERVEERDGLAEIVLESESMPVPTLLAMLARAGWPVVGDVLRGGVLLAGGLRLLAGDEVWSERVDGAAWWPDEPAYVALDRDGAPPRWGVSRATARVIGRGHPWILRDEDTDDPGRFAPGTLVRACTPSGPPLGLALIEGEGRPAARMWSTGAVRGSGDDEAEREAKTESIEARVARALARRRRLMTRGSGRVREAGEVHTDAIRLIHGEADALPGLAVDRLGGLLRVLVMGRASDHFRERTIDALIHGLGGELGPEPPVVEVLHLRELPAGRLECVRLARGDAAALEALGADERGRVVVHERGLAFWVDPGLGEPERSRPGFGLFLDQRENRERLGRHARRGGRWLNLFAHTGAFSVALLAAGAEHVTSVDLSAPYLDWLEENLDLNRDRGVDPRAHRTVRRDGRRYLEELGRGERFAGIVLDPPTAAAAGRRFWSVGRDLEPMIGEALRRLEPGGVLLMCRNERGARDDLTGLLERAAQAAGVRVERPRPAPPGEDFPSLRGFPEGDSFTGSIVQRSGSKHARGI
jgi:23S rRNA (cytosine1962-C5)-methyltransferase